MKVGIVRSLVLFLAIFLLFSAVSFSQELPESQLLEKLTGAEVFNYHTVPAILGRAKGDVYKIYEYVRDEIAFEAYQGSLRGVEGTLLARAGNSWDQAILLKALFDQINIKCKLVRSPLPEEYFADLKKQASIPARQTAFLPLELAGQLGINEKEIVDFNKSVSDFSAEVALETKNEHSGIKFVEGKKIAATDAQVYGDYLWVQAEIEEKLYDFHPVFPADTTLVLESLGVMNSRASVPEEINHWVRYRCFIERVSGETLARDLIFEKRIMASTSANKNIRFSLNPEKDKTGKVTLKPKLRRGTQLLSSKEVAVRSSENGNRQGVVTGVWLEVTVLSPGERPRSTTITLADSIPETVLWMERKNLKGPEIKTLADEELSASSEMLLLSSALPAEAAVEYDAELYRDLAKIRQFKVNELSRIRAANPTLVKWAVMLKPLLEDLSPQGRVYLDSPTIAAVLYRPVVNQGAVFLKSWAGILHFRSSGGASQELNGVAASVLLERVAGMKDSLPQANTRAGLVFSSVSKKEDIETFKPDWQLDAWNELQVDLLSGHTVYLPQRKEIQFWWKTEISSADPVLKGNSGWLKSWQVVESPLALTGNVSGELFFFINNEINSENGKEIITKGLSRFISTHLTSFSLSAASSLLDSMGKGKGNYAITEPDSD